MTNLGSGYLSVLIQEYRVALRVGAIFASAGASGLRFIAARDLNNDNRLDMVLANYGTRSVGVLIANGDGHSPNK